MFVCGGMNSTAKSDLESNRNDLSVIKPHYVMTSDIRLSEMTTRPCCRYTHTYMNLYIPAYMDWRTTLTYRCTYFYYQRSMTIVRAVLYPRLTPGKISKFRNASSQKLLLRHHEFQNFCVVAFTFTRRTSIHLYFFITSWTSFI